jgi:uncharacterized protein
MIEYYPRLIEKTITKKLKSTGALLLTGPKYCGKTTTAKFYSKSEISLITPQTIELVDADPKIALDGEKPRLIDEWQKTPTLWNYIRQRIDDDQEFGEYILTGSATPIDTSQILHSGAGRITTLKMRPLSLYESKESKGLVSLEELFNNKDFYIYDENKEGSLSQIAFYICRGGWPRSINKDNEVALDITRNYFESLFNFDNSDNKEIKNKNPNTLRLLLKSYARNISSQVKYLNIYKDMISNSFSLDKKTFDSYLKIAENLFIIEDLEAWTPTLRSKSTIRTTSTRHFVDTSIAALSLNISPNDLLNDSKTFGLMFEDLAIRDLKVYATYLDGKVFHYRDSNDLECDAIIHLNDGRWAAIEIKLGSEQGINEAIKNLKKLELNIDESMKKPSFKMVLTACGACYKKDDVYIAPINLLKP